MLVGSGFRVVTAADGEAGLELARTQHPDAILLDVLMPELNGFQTCRRLKEGPGTAGMPVIIATTKNQPADEFWAREVGADAFLSKPLDLTHLVALLHQLTERS
jgi:twitching motility two-component system response regulator PilH